MTRTVDVVVVGGGVIGLACAWRAAQRGWSVALLERGTVGSGASSVAAGILSPSHIDTWQGERGVAQAQAVRAWPAFAEELAEASDLNVPYRPSGILRLAFDRESAGDLERLVDIQRGHGVVSEQISGEDAVVLEPGITPPLAALHEPSGASVATRPLVGALAAAVRNAGVTIHESAAVNEVLEEAGRCVGVRTSDGVTWHADHVVAAMGAWTNEAAWLAGWTRVRVRPIKGQVVHVRSDRTLCERVLYGLPGSIVPRGGGRYVLAATVEDVGFDTSVTDEGVREVVDNAERMLPGVREATVERYDVGLRPMASSGEHYVGNTALPGLVLATGHYRNGILATSTVGNIVADLIT